MTGGDFHGRPTAFLENGLIRVEYLVSAGPRIVRVFLDGDDENQLAEVNHKQIESTEGIFNLMGGHRLWVAPETDPWTYIPDESGLSVSWEGGRLVLSGPVTPHTGLQKQMILSLVEGRHSLTILHRMTNCGQSPVELAPWAITMFPLGGEAVIPMNAPVKSPLQPNRQLTFWACSRLDDPRLQFSRDEVVISARAASPPLKVGCLNHAGWLRYRRNGWSFEKRFTPHLNHVHADMNCNTEVYLWEDFIELETLGPLARLEPGEFVEHEEVWEWQRMNWKSSLT